MRSHDVIVIGAGVIGLSLAWKLQKSGLRVLVVERGEPGREASYAAAGMIAVCDPHNDRLMQPLAEISAAMYPEFVHELEDESQEKVDLRNEGVITFLDPSSYSALHPKSKALTAEEVVTIEPGVVPRANAYFLPESWVDPRLLCSALLRAFKHRGGDVASGSPVLSVTDNEVRTEQTIYHAAAIVNCGGAWAGQLMPPNPTRPVKGQMLCVVPLAHPTPHPPVLRHVIRATDVYLVPRSDGRIIIGSTLEEGGFDKQVNPDVIQQLRSSAESILPAVKDMRTHDAWAGLRPGTPDGRPLLGKLAPNHYIAAGHYRDGILLAPATAEVMAALIEGRTPEIDLRPLAPNRFQR
ncbi:glycine oxidase ThiO [Candidatus Korobacter versatilis]|uniref:glycine oxidase ThiO n=1 Tax=Candidatus Korobacter versatilis TaxID=658062 RepID=UPI0002F9EDC7|nr:glycine oxidase ThiO [Candidatus Koribacter versatilis]